MQPDLVIETEIAHYFSASMLELKAARSGPGKTCVPGIDIDNREHNSKAIEAHPTLASRIEMDQGSSIALEADAQTTFSDSYYVVFDTIIEDIPRYMLADCPWGPDNKTKTTARECLQSRPEFAVDKPVENKLRYTVSPDGHLKRTSSTFGQKVNVGTSK